MTIFVVRESQEGQSILNLVCRSISMTTKEAIGRSNKHYDTGWWEKFIAELIDTLRVAYRMIDKHSLWALNGFFRVAISRRH